MAGRPLLLDLAAVTVLALAARALFHPALDTDPTYALIWGRDVVNGHLPDLAYKFAPTAHPLATIEGILAAGLGRHAAVSALLSVSYWSLGAVLWGVFRLGEAVFSRLVGVIAVLLVGSNFTTVNVAVGGFLDVPFLALVVWAAVLEVRRPRRGVAPLVLLALAGMLRPEAWLLAAVYWLYLLRSGDRRPVLPLLVSLGPGAWLLMGLLVTGDPLFAFANARASASAVPGYASKSGSGILSNAVSQLKGTIRTPVLLGGAVGFLLALRTRPPALRVLAPLLLVPLAAFVALTLLRLPVPDRMLLTPEVIVAILCAAAVAAWPRLRGLERRLWALGAAAVLGLLVVSTPTELSRLSELNSRRAGMQETIGDLTALGRMPAWRSARASCRAISAGRWSLIGYAAYYLDMPLRALDVVRPEAPPPGAYLALTGPRASTFLLGDDEPKATAVPQGMRRVAQNRSWVLYTRGC